jgi:hypothetical protein
MRHFCIQVLFLMALSTGLSAQLNTATQTIGSGANQLDITVTVNTTLSQVKFEMTGPSTVWFGFSFNTTTMSPGSYTILANVSGANPAEYIMVNHAAPTLQPVQNLTGTTASTAGGRKTYVFYRAISTGDANDYTFSSTPGNLDIAWAYGTTLAMGYHADRGGSSLNFINPCAPIPTISLPPVTICAGDSALIFGQYRHLAGQYTQTISTAWACDTLKTQNLVVVNPVTFQLPAIHVCTGDSVLIFGQYQHQPGTYSLTLQGANTCDSIVLQPLVVSNGAAFYDTMNLFLCHGDSLQAGGTWIHSPGMYTFFKTWQGCDTLYDVYKVSLVSIDTTLTNNSITLLAQPGYDFYTWIDCNTGLTVFSGSAAHVFTPPALGQFQVQIIQQGCTLVSNCHWAGPSSVGSAIRGSVPLKLFPNPSSGAVTLQVPDLGGNDEIQISVNDLNGREVYGHSLKQTAAHINLNLQHLPTGIYILSVKHQNHTLQTKLLIQR